MKVKIINLAVALALVLSLAIVALPAAGAQTPTVFSVSPDRVMRGFVGTIEIIGVGTHFNVYSVADFGGDGVVVHSTTPTSQTRVLAQISVSHAAGLKKRVVKVTTPGETASSGAQMFEVYAEKTCPQMSVHHWFVGDPGVCKSSSCLPKNEWPLDDGVDETAGVIGGPFETRGSSWNKPFATIQYAIDVAEARQEYYRDDCHVCECLPGKVYKDEMSIDVIHVWKGTYKENIVINETLTIMSDDSMDLCETMNGPLAPTMDGITTNNVNTIIQSCDPSVLITAHMYSWYQGAGTEKTAVAHFEGFTVEDGNACQATPPATEYSGKIVADGAVGAEIVDNIVNATQTGIEAINSAHIQILSNEVNVNDDHGNCIGIGVQDSCAAIILRNVVKIGCLTGDDFAPMTGQGILVTGSPDAGSPASTIDHNQVTVKALKYAAGIYVMNSDNTEITCNIVTAQIVCDEKCVEEEKGNCECLYKKCTQAWGIFVINCKNVLINNNTKVGVIARAEKHSEGVGIYVASCVFAKVSNNKDVNVDADLTGERPCKKSIVALGIVLTKCLLSDVVLNTVTVNADCDAEGCEDPNCCPDCCGALDEEEDEISPEAQAIIDAMATEEAVDANNVKMTLIIGIAALDSQSILIDNNTVTVTSNDCPLTCSQCCKTFVLGIALINCGVAEGPCCLNARLSKVTNNGVTVIANAGICQIIGGIKACGCKQIVIQKNTVKVTGNLDGDASVCVKQPPVKPDQIVDTLIEQVLGIGPDAELALAIGFGIWVNGSNMNVVDDNVVNVDMNVDVDDPDGKSITDGDALAAGGAVGLGIMETFSYKPAVTRNAVTVTADVIATAEAETPEVDGAAALGGGIALAVGIGAYMTPGILINNNDSSQAYATVNADVIDRFGCESFKANSAAGQLDSEVMTAVYDVINQTLTSDEVDAKIATGGDPFSAYALGGGLAAGIGILTVDCVSPLAEASVEGVDPAFLPFMMNGAVITYNQQVVGQGTVRLHVGPIELLPGTQEAASAAGGLGLGVGIASVFCAPIEISNNAVTATGIGDVVVAAVDPGSLAMAAGIAAGVGLGIIVVSPAIGTTVEDDAYETHKLFQKAIINNNTVIAHGDVRVLVGAYAGGLPSEALALGAGLGAGLGITVIGFPGAKVICNTTVDAEGKVDADAEAIALSGVDPYVIGAGAGIGVGIAVALCPVAQVLNNTVTANGTATVDLGATEKKYVDILVAGGAGAGLGAGLGIIVIGSPCALVGGIPDQRIPGNIVGAKGYVFANVTALDEQSFGGAWEIALGAGVGMGITVVTSNKAKIQNNCSVWGDGSARVYSQAVGTFNCDIDLGLAIDADITVALSGDPRDPRKTVVAKYNTMEDPTNEGINEGPVFELDAGMLVLLAVVDARYNYWNDPTGPSGDGYGFGEPLVKIMGKARFEPWLYADHCAVGNDTHRGKFGFSIKKCWSWNTFSAPIKLSSIGDTWTEILENSKAGNAVEIIYSFNSETQQFVQVVSGNENDKVEPLYGFYIRMAEDARFLLYADSTQMVPPPSRTVKAGLNLIGPNPIFYEYGIETGKIKILTTDVRPAIISPQMNEGYCAQRGWVWTTGYDDECMLIGNAYWLILSQDGTLMGVQGTPTTLEPQHGGCSVDPCEDR